MTVHIHVLSRHWTQEGQDESENKIITDYDQLTFLTTGVEMTAVVVFATLCEFFKLFSLIFSYFVAAPCMLYKERPEGIGKFLTERFSQTLTGWQF